MRARQKHLFSSIFPTSCKDITPRIKVSVSILSQIRNNFEHGGLIYPSLRREKDGKEVQ